MARLLWLLEDVLAIFDDTQWTPCWVNRGRPNAQGTPLYLEVRRRIAAVLIGFYDQNYRKAES